jgi:hypothetical protein
MSDPLPSADFDAGCRAPVNGPPGGTISWSEHEKAWEAYHRRHHGQDAETIASRGGFGLAELTIQLGHLPKTWRPGDYALREMARFRVVPEARRTRVLPPAGGQA